MNDGIIITIQAELIFSLAIIVGLCIAFAILGKKMATADPTKKPTGAVLVVETAVNMIQGYMQTIMPSKFAKNYYPYFAMIFVYLFVCNVSGLFAFQPPTGNLSITLAISFITFALIQYNAIKTKGGFKYILNILWPPTNILSMLAPLISLSMRIFGNILSGTILMTLIYQLTGWISGMIIPINFDFLGPIIVPVLHMYFDVFAALIQTVVFVTLSSIFIAMEAE